LRPLRKFAGELRTLQGQLSALASEQAPQAADTKLREDQLARLQTLSKELQTQYNAFEDAASKAQSPETDKTLQGLRTAFADRLAQWLDLLGRDYQTDPQLERSEYVEADMLQQAVVSRGHLDADALRAHWTAAVRARQQAELDVTYAPQEDAIRARIETVHELRRSFNAAAEQLGNLNMGNGVLTPQAAALLELYDSYSGKLETLWTDWQKFSSGLPGVADRPDQLAQLAKRYVDLLKSEHLDCFTQMYRVYALDHALTHPAYKHLKDHYEFVKREWRDQDAKYRAVYTQYEGEWSRNYTGPGSYGGGETEPGTPPAGSPDLGPPGGSPAPSDPGQSPTAPGQTPTDPQLPPLKPPSGN
jgi:hypothetical protein